MAIAHPFAIDVKAFSAAYGELRDSVNAAGSDETRLKDFGLSALQAGLSRADCAAGHVDAILAEAPVKAFSDDHQPLVWR
jgi:hypothetical protein